MTDIPETDVLHPRESKCRVYWGSHGCTRPRGHDGMHVCVCGEPPYFGKDTNFYGEDAPPLTAEGQRILEESRA